MSESANHQKLARTLLEHRDRGAVNSVPPAESRDVDAALAYGVQHAMERILVDERGWMPIGYKLGATNAAAKRILKVRDSFFGRLYDRTTLQSPATLTFVAGFHRLHEPEIALLIGRDLPPSGAPYDAASIEAATRAVLPAIEIIGTWFEPWSTAGGTNLIADNGIHGAWVFGEPIEDWSAIDLIDGPVTLTIDGEVKATGKGGNIDGGAFGATAWLANTLAAMGRTLHAGEFVTTGSTTPTQPVAAGQQVVADYGRLGRIEIRMTG